MTVDVGPDAYNVQMPSALSISSSTSPKGLESLNPLSEIVVRTYQPCDHAQVMRLHREGLLIGMLDPLDAAPDLKHIEEVYLRKPQDHFWVAEARGLLIASIGLTEGDPQVAHLRRLRVDPAWRKGLTGEVSRLLIRKAVQHAREYGQLKLVFHTRVNDERAVAFLHQLGFEFTRAKELRGKHLLEFYLNLYERPDLVREQVAS